MSSFFVYGTLTDAERVDSLLDDWSYGPTVELDGLHRVEGRYPTLAPGGSVHGRILRTDDVATLDEYEGVASGLYIRVEVPRDDGGEAFVYVGDAARLDADAEWPGSGPLRTRVTQYLDANRAIIKPIESGDDKRQTGV
ncbi:aig2-like family protein [Halogeometricum borinquense DSM 11551]|uniref:AIG2-like family protein n=1 Tax=Halogeometricum borinquense (strain ATCC 700274 / DSM 11551 / JCM 10706 / KCTC 4070 / PR3) TaxID=469382 RepID=E4NTX1_HALBP|nr:gamma-glutamylcyclotransferase family protein [Halogeometricum borinquense]ADQ68276.1 AIG2-like family protein [Halogeometricum borinquense DSM 11551]ELY24681.1 aig2-like family protein [Halogeometricum borinquense DSM 11551]